MVRFISVVVASFILFSANAQHYTQQVTNVKNQARLMADATIKKDYARLMKFINPDGFPKGKLNAMTDKKMLTTLKLVDSQMVKQGIAIQSINFGDVLSILKENGELQCTLPQITVMKMQFGSIVTKSTLIAVSLDNGITWKFTDAIGRDKIEIRRLMPKISDKLLFAPKEAPQFIKAEEKPTRK